MIHRSYIKYALKILQPFRRLIDKCTGWLPGAPADNADTARMAAQGPIRAGLWLMLIVFGLFGLWAVVAPLDSAAIAHGQVVLNANRKAIQHLEGGIVEEILVQEGRHVEANQPLLRLRGIAYKSKLASLKIQYFTAKAAEARLRAEENGQAALTFPDALRNEAKNDKDKQKVLENQRKLFVSRREGMVSQISGLKKKIDAYRHDMEGLSTQKKAAGEEIALLEEEVASAQRLFDKGYASKPRLLALKRQLEELRGQRGQYQSSIARIQQNIAEIRQQIITLEQEASLHSADEMKETQALLAELSEQVNASGDIVKRVTITSPIAGYVTGLAVHTVGGVIAPGEKLMDIVPANDKLIIEAQVSPQDIDIVHPGLTAHIRLSSYRSRWAPDIVGKVITVSADRMTDPHTQTAYYLARIEVDQEKLKQIENVVLYPGMPAETLIVTGERTLIDYLFLPVSEAMRRSFRED